MLVQEEMQAEATYSVGLWLLLPILEPESDFVVWLTSLDKKKKKETSYDSLYETRSVYSKLGIELWKL